MPRSRMLARIDDELVQAKKSLAFWHQQKSFLAETSLHDYADQIVKLRENDVKQLVEVQEALARAKNP